MNEFEYIYLLQDKNKENIYKIDKSNKLNFIQFPKNYVLILQIACLDCDVCEKEIMNVFRKKFVERKDIGVEYFQGDCRRMNLDIISIVTRELLKDDDDDSIDSKHISRTCCRAERRYLQRRFI
jgi:hypothetical protein